MKKAMYFICLLLVALSLCLNCVSCTKNKANKGAEQKQVEHREDLAEQSEDRESEASAEAAETAEEQSETADDGKKYVSCGGHTTDEAADKYTYIKAENETSYITEELMTLLEEHRGEDVWYTVFININTEEVGGDADEEYYNKALEYAESVGAVNIVSAVDASDRAVEANRCYYMDVQESALNALLEYGHLSIAMAHKRVGEYANSVTDHLTTLLEEADDDAVFDVWVLTNGDVSGYEDFNGKTVNYQRSAYMTWMQSSFYAMNSSIHKSFTYAVEANNLTNIDAWPTELSFSNTLINERLNSISLAGYNCDGAEKLMLDGQILNPDIRNGEKYNMLSIDEENKEQSNAFLSAVSEYTDSYMEGVIDGAGIAEKVNGNDYIDQAMALSDENGTLPDGNLLPAKRLSRYVVSLYPATYEAKGELHWAIIPAFEAKGLTKEEILKLAEDDKVRAIYSTDQNGTVLSILNLSGYTAWV